MSAVDAGIGDDGGAITSDGGIDAGDTIDAGPTPDASDDDRTSLYACACELGARRELPTAPLPVVLLGLLGVAFLRRRRR